MDFKKVAVFVLCFILVFGVFGVKINSSAIVSENDNSICLNDSWPMFQKDLQNSGIATENSMPFTDDPEILWSSSITDERLTVPPIIYNGKVFVGGYNDMAHKTYKGSFSCFDAETGEKLWGIPLDDTVPRKIGESADKAQFFQTGIDSPPSAYENKIIFTTASAHVYCINQEDGEILWEKQLSFSGSSKYGKIIRDKNNQPTSRCHSGGLVWNEYYFVPIIHHYRVLCKQSRCEKPIEIEYGELHLFKIDINTGEIEGKFATNGAKLKNTEKCELRFGVNEYAMKSNPVYLDGYIYMMGVTYLYKINTETMAEEWSSVVTDSYPYFSSPMIGNNGIYYGNNDERFFCLSENSGKIIWSTKTKQSIRCSSAPVKIENKLFFPTQDKQFICYNSETLRTEWINEEKNLIISPPVVANGNIIYITSGTLKYINHTDGSEIWSVDIDSDSNSAPSICNGKIYVAMLNGTLCCIGEKPKSLKIENAPTTLSIGETSSISVEGYCGETKERIHYSLRAEPKGIVSMDGNKITAIAEGEVTITAICGLVENKCKIKILEKETHERSYSMFEIECEKNELEVGESSKISIHAQGTKDSTKEMEVECYIKEPFYAKMELIKDLKWVSDDGAKRIQQEYKITGMSPGKTELIVNVTGAQPHKMPIIIGHNSKVSKITLSPENPTIFVGEELQLEAKAYDEEGNVIPNTPMKWENLDPEIAELTPDGLFKAFEPGTCKIRASHGTSEAEMIVTIVKEKIPAEISISTNLIAFPAARKGEKVSTSIEIKNIGDETANAEIKCDREWIVFVPEKINLEAQESTIIMFTANTESLEANSMGKCKNYIYVG